MDGYYTVLLLHVLTSLSRGLPLLHFQLLASCASMSAYLKLMKILCMLIHWRLHAHRDFW